MADETDKLVHQIINEKPNAIIGGWPCQDISTAGKGAGLQGERSGLWRYFFRTIRLVRPKIALLENVAALLFRGMGEVLGDLASVGYDAEWNCLRASDFNLPHERERIWILANPTGERLETLHMQLQSSFKQKIKGGAIALDTSSDIGKGGRRSFCGEPPIFRAYDGSTDRLDFRQRHHGIGNGNPPCIIRELTKGLE